MGKGKLNILIDSGSTNSFIDQNTTNELSCIIPWAITIADGGKTTSKYKCTQFRWQMQGVSFVADLGLLKLVGCDVILRAYWMWE